MGCYLVIEGVIGVGKTTLCRYLARDTNIKPILETFENNPFLTGGFYKNPTANGFETQIFFLLSRFRQQRELQKVWERRNSFLSISDYLFDKDRIFAQANLDAEDYQLYLNCFKTFQVQVRKPELVVYLKSGGGTIMNRIALRDREFERDISKAYIQKLIDHYDEYFTAYAQGDESPRNVLVLDAERYDFVNNPADYEAIKTCIFSKLEEATHEDGARIHRDGREHRGGEVDLHDNVC